MRFFLLAVMLSAAPASAGIPCATTATRPCTATLAQQEEIWKTIQAGMKSRQALDKAKQEEARLGTTLHGAEGLSYLERWLAARERGEVAQREMQSHFTRALMLTAKYYHIEPRNRRGKITNGPLAGNEALWAPRFQLESTLHRRVEQHSSGKMIHYVTTIPSTERAATLLTGEIIVPYHTFEEIYNSISSGKPTPPTIGTLAMLINHETDHYDRLTGKKGWHKYREFEEYYARMNDVRDMDAFYDPVLDTGLRDLLKDREGDGEVQAWKARFSLGYFSTSHFPDAERLKADKTKFDLKMAEAAAYVKQGDDLRAMIKRKKKEKTEAQERLQNRTRSTNPSRSSRRSSGPSYEDCSGKSAVWALECYARNDIKRKQAQRTVQIVPAAKIVPALRGPGIVEAYVLPSIRYDQLANLAGVICQKGDSLTQDYMTRNMPGIKTVDNVPSEADSRNLTGCQRRIFLALIRIKSQGYPSAKAAWLKNQVRLQREQEQRQRGPIYTPPSNNGDDDDECFWSSELGQMICPVN